MPGWTGQWNLDSEIINDWERKKAEYVAAHGYRITIPGLDDIFHLPFDQPMTEEEEDIWKRRAFGELSEARYNTLKEMKARKRERYLDMLGSPIPSILEHRATILTAIDDIQDAMYTMAVLQALAATVTPPPVSVALLGAAGWLMIGSTCLNLITGILAPEQGSLNRKREKDRLSKDNPFSKKANVRQVKNLTKVSAIFPALIQGLQTTDNLFGIGVSLGGVMNLPFAMGYGLAKYWDGSTVKVYAPYSVRQKFHNDVGKATRATEILMSIPHETDDEEMTGWLLAANACMQAQRSLSAEWNPLEQVQLVQGVKEDAPTPEHVLIREIIEEEDPEGFTAVGWPSTGELTSFPITRARYTYETATNNLVAYCERQKFSQLGLAGAMAASQSSMYAMEALEGPDTVDYNYTAVNKITHALLDLGYGAPDGLTDDQKDCFLGWLDDHESVGTTPTIPETLSYVKNNCGWEFIRP
ncbi:hypothetical protein LCGC14_0811800 [marine sediment metagenome]|uniref:Uncharacterized protein n=1 Tax=marine sediment metagenome TaxID=412755 RepID=A0A0F9Q6R0_9ZZZZ